tara:strand:- start:61 stop:1329 length:1269 start_codon:yes stop_codon:yes gene_type:complete
MAYVFGIDGTEHAVPEPNRDYENIQQDYSDLLKQWEGQVSSRFQSIREWRTGELNASDWTQVSDNSLDSSTKTAWAEYRTKLRNLPAVAEASGFITSANWPLAPGQSEIPDYAHDFINSFTDPLGVAVTSYVSQISTPYNTLIFQNPLYEFPAGSSVISVATTSGFLVDDIISVGSTSAKITDFGQSILTQEHKKVSTLSVGIGATIICVRSVDDIIHGDTFTTKNIDKSANITVSGIGTTSITLSSGITTSIDDNEQIFILRQNNNTISLGSTLSTSIGIGDTITVTRDKLEYIWEDDKYPHIVRTLTSNKTNLLENQTADFTLNMNNIGCEQSLRYEVSLIEGQDQFNLNDIITTPSSGNISIIPTAGTVTGVGTISVGIAQTIGITSTTSKVVLKVDILDVSRGMNNFGIGKTVGVSTV